jgi:enoyl-CoA hydratase/carnithine racemase
MRYILTSEGWGAAEEYRLGLVQELTPPGKQLDRALEFADTIATARRVRGARFGASGDQWRRPRPGCTVASLRADSAERGR